MNFNVLALSQFWAKIVRILCIVKPKIHFGRPQSIVEPTMHCRLTMRNNASQFYPTFGDVAGIGEETEATSRTLLYIFCPAPQGLELDY